MIPCRECLVLPACKNKEELRCWKLYEWSGENEGEYVGDQLVEYLPNWLVISDEPKGYDILRPYLRMKVT